MKTNILVGDVFGHLKVIEILSNTEKRKSYLCQCDCGKIVKKGAYALLGTENRRPDKSCGCKEYNQEKMVVKYRRLYSTWFMMIDGCYNKESSRFYKYGAKGIKVCDEWKNDFLSFLKWSLESGYREEQEEQLNRINPKGNYEPMNCRWADKYIQATNKGLRRNNKTGYQCICEGKNTYRVDTMRFGIKYHIGCYKKLDDAIKARDNFFIEHGWDLPLDK